LADTPEFREFVDKEFPSYSPEGILNSSRRSFLKIMGASVALAGLTGCRRWPVRKLAPYNKRPEGYVPGEAEFYASAFELDGVAQPILVKAYDGRPVKIEGNPDHPASHGAASLLAQASVLNLYDPFRAETRLKDGKWDDVDQRIGQIFNDFSSTGGEGVVVLVERTSSPTVARLVKQLKSKYPNVKVAMQGGAPQATRPIYSLADAEVIVSLDADFLGGGADQLRLTREFAQSRKSVDEKHKMSRLYVTEPTYTITGSNADERLAIGASKIGKLAQFIFEQLQFPGLTEAKEGLVKHAMTVAKDLKSAGSHGVVMVGDDQPAEVHAMAAQINKLIGSAHVKYVDAMMPADDQLPASAETVIVLGGNPAYDGDAATVELLKSAQTLIHLTAENNETAAMATMLCPQAHYLEAWGDTRSAEGAVSIVQPLIRPLFNGRSVTEMLAVMLGQQPDGYELVRQTHAMSERDWRKALHDGFVADSGYTSAAAPVARVSDFATPAISGYEVVLRPSYQVHDGSFANNGWCQELPDPMTKLTWDNAAIMSPATAEKLKVSYKDRVTITVNGESAELPVYTLPGVADDTVVVNVGYGRTQCGPVGVGVGVDVYPLKRAAGGATFAQAKVAKATGTYKLATTQNHWAMDKIGRKAVEKRVEEELIRSTTVDDYKKHPDFVFKHSHGIALPLYGSGKDKHEDDHKGDKDDHSHDHGHGPVYQGGDAPDGFSPARSPQPFTNPLDRFAEDADYQWGMAVDLNACTGCNACVVACQAENNIPGRRQGARSDAAARCTGFAWTATSPATRTTPSTSEAVHQPVACVHCENAPCEQVCPVAATVHDAEGLNVMVYNRCIGTRYCSNNCPYKVRRFNYFDYNARDPRGSNNKAPFLGIPDQEQQSRSTRSTACSSIRKSPCGCAA
jgi:MoCo/4Fe-4S cofactor protein with predicted Tat translocation signal